MGIESKISWTEATFNGWIGCTKVSPGCTNCYAEDLDNRRFGGGHWGVGKGRKRTGPANWREPIKWDKACAANGTRKRVFCSSLSDWLDPEVPIEWLADLLALIVQTPNLDWLLLTKRPHLWRERIGLATAYLQGIDEGEMYRNPVDTVADWLDGNPWPNVWVGTTVEDQRRCDERIPALLSIPARVRFLSCEPLLEAVDLTRIDCDGRALHPDWCQINPLTGRQTDMGRPCQDVPMIDWVIVGGESGPKARPFDLAWARSIVRQCKEAGVAVWVKQMGDLPMVEGQPTKEFTAHHGADPAQWPEVLRVQNLPTPRG